MPPWPADPNYSHFADERVLSDNDIASINEWVIGGMPEGDTNLAPQPPVYNNEVIMLNPDDTIILPAYTIPTDVDDYRTFVIHSGYTETKYINQMEFIPGDGSAVHHAIFHHDTSNVSYQHDLDDPLPGYETTGFGIDPSPYSISCGGWNPGQDIFKLPYNMAFQILPNGDFAISIHYGPGNMGEIDTSKLYLKFSSVPDSEVRSIYKTRWLFAEAPVLVDGPLYTPANMVRYFNEVSFPTSHKSLLGLNPHSHHLCTSWEVRMVTAPGDTTNLLYIPNWSFEWQYTYFLTKVMEIPLGATMLGKVRFDNTTNNPDNPNDPPKPVHEGQHSDDEMMICGFWLMDYKAGDENIIIDSAFYGLPTLQESINNYLSLNIFPNPVSDVLHFVSDLPSHDINWELINLFGVVVKSNKLAGVSKGIFTQDIDVANLSSGIYQIRIQSGGKTAVKKLTIIR
jgi:hypothetical protein